jgi:WD40 repeat protein
MADVFISYSKARQSVAADLATELENLGFDVWWDTALIPTGSFSEEIDRQLDAATAVIVIWSPEAVRSKWVRSEATHADRDGKLINARTADLTDPARNIPKPFDQINAALVDDLRMIVRALDALKVPRSRTVAPAVAHQPAPAISAADADELLFNEAERVNTAAAYQYYLDELPEGRHVLVAQFRLRGFAEVATTTPAPAPAVPKSPTQSEPQPKRGSTSMGGWLSAILPSAATSTINRSHYENAKAGLIRTFRGHTKPILAVAVTPDGRFALSGVGDPGDSIDYVLRLWDVASGNIVSTLEGHTGPVLAIAISPDGCTALSGANEVPFGIRVWDLASGTQTGAWRGHCTPVSSIEFTADGRTVVSGSWDGTVMLWEVGSASTSATRTFVGHTERVAAVAMSPDGWRVVSGGGEVAIIGGKDFALRLWDVATGRQLATFEGHTRDLKAVAFSPDGRAIASGSDDASIKLWNADIGAGPASATGTLIRTLSGHRSDVQFIAFTPDGRTLLSGSWDKTLKLWDVATGRELRTFKGHTGAVTSVAILPDGRRAISASYDTTLKLWDLTA